MKGQRIAYIRVSSADQNTDRQLEGMEFDETFTDHASGKDAQRPQLEALLRHARRGDAIYVHSMDRLARNLDDLRRLVHDLTARGVEVHFVREQLVFSGDDNPMAKFLLSVMGAFAEFEREMIRSRQREGIALAAARGAYKGRKPLHDAKTRARIAQRALAGESKSALAAEFGLTRGAVYKLLTTCSKQVA